MKKFFAVSAVALFALAHASNAFALEVSNDDSKTHTLIISVGEIEHEVAIESGMSIEEECGKCTLILNGDDSTAVDAVEDDKFSIHDGKLVAAH